MSGVFYYFFNWYKTGPDFKGPNTWPNRNAVEQKTKQSKTNGAHTLNHTNHQMTAPVLERNGKL